jgi:hypothetical protein
LRHPVGIDVTLGVDSHDHPRLAERIDRHVERAIENEVETHVRYVVVDTA